MFSGAKPIDLIQFHAGDRRGTSTVTDEFGGRQITAGQMQGVDQTGDRDDGGAVLVVVKHRDVHRLTQPLLDDEAIRRLDVFQIDATEGWAEELHAIDEFVDVLGAYFQVDGIDIGKALEQHCLALHHRLGGQGAQIAEGQEWRCHWR